MKAFTSSFSPANSFVVIGLEQPTMRVFHQKIAALLSAALVALFGGVAHGDRLMAMTKRSRPAVPRVYTTRSGSRYVRSIDVIRSEAGRREISLQLQKKSASGKSSSSDKTERSRKSDS